MAYFYKRIAITGENSEKQKKRYFANAQNIFLIWKRQHGEREKGTFKMKGRECETCLNADQIVKKSDRRIVFRGELDDVSAYVIYLIALYRETCHPKLWQGLCQIRDNLIEISVSEVKRQPVKYHSIWGLAQEQLRERSHDPQKYFGCGHLFQLDDSTSLEVARMNRLRTKVRKLECLAVEVFEEEYGIVALLNQLSSAAYLLMLHCHIQREME